MPRNGERFRYIMEIMFYQKHEGNVVGKEEGKDECCRVAGKIKGKWVIP